MSSGPNSITHNPLHFPNISTKQRFRRYATQIITFSSENRKSKTESLIVEFKTLGDCKLGISRYPDFKYNAQGGRGKGIATVVENDDMDMIFDLDSLYIPPLTSATTKFLGLPLPPFLKIDIVPELLQGTIDRRSGKVLTCTRNPT